MMPASLNYPYSVAEDDHLLHVLSQLPSFEEALARLLYVVEHRRPCGLVLGPAGTGKSALLQILFRELSGSASLELSGSASLEMSCRPLLIDLRGGRHNDLGWAIAAEMGLSPDRMQDPESQWRLIEDRFQGATMSGQSIVPIIDHLEQADESHLAGLMRCRYLAERYESTILLSARPPLSSSVNEIIGPMCELRIELPTCTPEETGEFVSRMWRDAATPVLCDEAVATLHGCAGGRLRETVQLMRLAVFAARAEGIETIDAQLLQAVAEELWTSGRSARTCPISRPTTVELESSPA